MPIDANDMAFVCDLVAKRSGIILDDGKAYLVEARLGALARKLAVADLATLVAKARSTGLHGTTAAAIIEAMTTNETSFFRDNTPFEAFAMRVLPEIMGRRCGERTLNLWCAASSTGQEPYSLAMMIKERFPQLASWRINFIASDLSQDVLAKARAGRYTQMEMNRGLPAPLLVKYFQKVGLEWEIKPELREMIDFRQVNLLDPWPAMPPLDVVFIRNVLIYFNAEMKKQILGRIHSLLRPDGYLFLGAAETTLNINEGFERAALDKSGCYRLRSTVARKVAA